MNYIPMEEIEHALIFGGGIIGVLNGLVAKARGAKRVTIADISADRLGLLKELNLPFDNYVDTSKNDIGEWVKTNTNGRGVDAVVVAASVKPLVGTGLKLLRRAGHLSIFAGMPKSDPLLPLDLNLIHYLELNVHGANSSSHAEYLAARDFIVSGKIDARPLVTHRFPLERFDEAVKTHQILPAAPWRLSLFHNRGMNKCFRIAVQLLQERPRVGQGYCRAPAS